MKKSLLSLSALLFCLLFLTCTVDRLPYKQKEDKPDTSGTGIRDTGSIKDTSFVHEDVDDIYDYFDPFFRFQGYLNYSGKFGLDEYRRQGAIDILPAWEITMGAGVKITVIDDGIQKNHEELAGISIWNVIDGSNSCEPIRRNDSSHGTAVSGVITAMANGIGIIGVAPESDFLFIGDPTGKFSDADVLKAFEYAKNWGTRIISCSWGSYAVSSTFESMIKNFYDEGMVFVFATGNKGYNLDNKPQPFRNGKDESELEWVIGVSASNPGGVLASFSDYGSKLDIMAPGQRILTLDLMGIEGANNANSVANNNYTFQQGASFAAPIVAGVAALILSVRPDLTPSEVRQIIIDTARKNPPVNGSGYNANGFSLYHAYGLIDAGKAVQKARGSTAIK